MEGDLEHALRTGSTIAARRAAAQLVEASEHDAALALIAQYAPGSPEVAELLLEILDSTGVVHRFAGALLLDKTAVDDVAQDSLISVAESIDSYSGTGKVTTWVHSIVKRRAVDHLRRQRETAELNEQNGPAARMSSMIATRTTVQDALAALPEKYRIPVTMRDIDSLPYAEIAQRLDLSVGTVKAQISRGRAMVAARLQNADATGGETS
ncbi:RNA polymerase sigma factor [Nesterenkonia ebinurensis]|uniref:RNA polymerase sigma factor n=1 Tax=Nesterenkonia ebinurensis TaxID=2608252 RepID=UPI00168B3629|nr:RNA polymerase sigma factor [Nesterenkonia ebinurensis]